MYNSKGVFDHQLQLDIFLWKMLSLRSAASDHQKCSSGRSKLPELFSLAREEGL